MAFLFYFHYMNSIIVNGKVMPADEPVLMASNRGYRYGDGLFETMRVARGEIILASLHSERFFSGLTTLRYQIPKLLTFEKLQKEVLQLCQKNNCVESARVRLSVFRGNGGLYDDLNELQYIIECWPMNESMNTINENGLWIDIYPDARKTVDKCSNLKSANYLPYVMAALYAKENKLNDCLLLNSYERICDATIANIFWVKDGIIFTPPLSEGCVAGVMRKYLLQRIPDTGYEIKEKELVIDELENADEIFLTNATYGIRWVKQFRDKFYKTEIAPIIYKKLIAWP
ncbi:MAG: aminotransferase class IV [Chitinophagaceae bacterium]